MSKVQQHLPDLELPKFAYHPGITWKSESFPAMEKIKSESNLELQAQHAYLYGWDLANHSFHWESHEAWELAWNLWGRKTSEAQVVQGLIFLTAARLKFITQKFCSAEKLSKKAKNRLFLEKNKCTELGFNPEIWLKNWDPSQKWPSQIVLPTCF